MYVYEIDAMEYMCNVILEDYKLWSKFPSEAILIQGNGGSKKMLKHNKLKYIGSNIEEYRCFTHEPIPEWNQFPSTTFNTPSVEIFKDRLKTMPSIIDHNCQYNINEYIVALLANKLLHMPNII